MIIHLIRHGKTYANEQKLYCGAADLPLSDNGIFELKEFKKQGIYTESADIYYTSGLMRTEQTLNILFGYVNRTALTQLAEFNFGIFEMKSHELIKDQPDYMEWINDETGLISCPGGENRQEFKSRAVKGYEMIEENAKHVNSAFVVCHGGVIACIMEHLFPDDKDFYKWQPVQGRGYTITCAQGGIKLYKTI